MFLRRAKTEASLPLPTAIYTELVGLLFANLFPIMIMGLIVAGIGVVITLGTRDVALGVLTIACVLLAGFRFLLVVAFRRQISSILADIDSAKHWERRYAIASFSFSILLGLFSARALWIDESTSDMLVTGLVFGYAAGLVARSSVRPWICIPSLALVTVPLIGASMAYLTPGHTAHAILLTTFMLASFETVLHTYRTTVRHIETKQEMASLARYDDLTKLPNRLLLRERFNRSLAEVRRDGSLIALHYLDLDHFKPVNDRFGHPVGDALLAAVAQRLSGLTRSSDTVARLGGDEFVIVQVGIQHRDEAEMLARRIIRTLSTPFSIDGHEIRIGTSVGISMLPRDGMTMEEAISCADTALYASKSRGRGGLAFCNEAPPPSSSAMAV
jgi:diguanylate cyclase